MLRNHLPTILIRGALAIGGILLPFACAHGVENSLEEPTGVGGPTGVAGQPITGAAGATGGPGTGGGAGTDGATTGATGGAGAAGTSTVATGGTGGSSTTAGATGGATGSGGNGGTGGSAGTGGTGNGGSAGTGGAAGSAGATGTGGASGSAGAGGMSGSAGSGGSAAGSAGAPDAGQPPRPRSVTLGTTVSQKCATNEVIIGYSGTVEAAGGATNWLRSFQAICGSLAVTGTTTFSVTTTQTATLTAHGVPQAVTQTRMCPTDQMVTGFTSKTGGAIDELTFGCAPLTITGTAAPFTLAVGTSAQLAQYLGGPGGAPAAAPINCPAGQIAVGDEGREGGGTAGAIEAFGLLCARPTLVVQ